MEKENILSIREDKKFSLGNIRFETSVCHRSPPPPPTNCISLLFMIRAVNSNIQLASNKSTSEREREREKKFPSPLEKFREYALCRPLKEAKAIEVSLNKLEKTSSFPTLF